MDQETVTYLLIAALLATAVLIALAVVVPRLARRNGEPVPAVPAAAAPAVRLDPLADRGIAMTVGPGMTGGGRGHAEVDMGRAVSETAASPVDVSTGLITASGWGRILTDEDARVRRYRRPATVVMIELDGLERLTSRLGEGAGDRLIPAVADTVRRLAREADHVARLGQSRFGVLLPETDEVQAINYVERVRRTCDLWLESGAVALRLAIGWASASGDDNLHDAGRTATERMYAEIHRNARRTGDLVGPAGGEPESRPG
ncbi:MAG TPA: GGDEF domain-containing protein [Clostridia bacterium]|nr:GGDEF domain-containing protein [Clostridia bacterium]